MQSVFEYGDELGPTKVVHVREPGVGLEGILVVDNVSAGPSVGGIRMAPDVTLEECLRLARAMTLKNAAAGLPHGGGKAVVRGDPKMPKADKERIIRALACALRDIQEYILAPDMGTNEECMAWIKDEVDRVVGLPREVGGIPLDELGATGWGLCAAAEVASEFCGLKLEGARVAIQGFGAVGMHAARFLAERGAVLVAASDTGGTIHEPGGLDVTELMALKQSDHQSVTAYGKGRKLDRDACIGIDCDIWVPAARPDVIDESNADQLKATLVLQGANIPITHGAERMLHERGVLCVPDFIANAGGVICAVMEYQRATQTAAFDAIEEKVRANTHAVLTRVRDEGLTPRAAAVALARERVERTMSWSRWGLFSTSPRRP